MGRRGTELITFPTNPIMRWLRSYRLWKLKTRARLGLSPDRRRLVYSGRLVDVKRVDLVIDAFNSVAPQRPAWDLVIVGDGPLRGSLEQRIKPELRNRVIWTGYLSKQGDVAAIYRCSDALVLASEYEPWAVVVNEAAAAGLALLCSDVVGAAAELLRDGRNGRMFPTGNLDALREAMLDVTDASKIDAYRAASPEVLKEWRELADPVAGLVKALREAKVLS